MIENSASAGSTANQTNEDVISVDESGSPVNQPNSAQPGKPTKNKRPKITHKQWLLLAAVVLLAGTLVTWRLASRHTTMPTPTPAVQPKSNTVASNLTGLQVNPKLNQLPVIGVMIENSQDARPQAGLTGAGIVFEAIAEGGITRFLALYQNLKPTYLGPVRSVRPYYIQWALPFQASIAHVGGSPEALAAMRSLGARDLDQFANGGSYDRITARVAPHNVYTGVNRLVKLAKSKGFKSSHFESWPRKTEEPAAKPSVRQINFTISSDLFNVHYTYDHKTNSYKRSEGGQVHRDDKTHTQIHPKVVIALVMNHGLEADGLHSIYHTTGSGQMFVFQDGTLTKGHWHKSGPHAQFSFTDQNQQPLKLNPGQTWVTVVGQTNQISYHR